MQEPLWLKMMYVLPLVILVGSMVYRWRKARRIERTLKKRDDGKWLWTDRRGTQHLSDTNPLDDMDQEGAKAKRDWRQTQWTRRD